MGWWHEHPPCDTELAELDQFASATGLAHWQLGWRQNRGQQPNKQTLWTSASPPPLSWLATEGAIVYEFRRDGGLSPGLFLDQENNRRWVQDQSENKKVLNLFSYTGGFSLAAAKGGALSVTSVDLSAPYLQWTKINFNHNQLDATDPKFRFFSWDSREFLRWAHKKSETFDLVICDPPSFARSAKGAPFRIEKDLPQLLESLAKVLAPQGTILFSFNFEGWNEEQSHKQIRYYANALGLSMKSTPPLPATMNKISRSMKSYFLVS